MAPKDNRARKRLRDVQCRPSMLRKPIHELASSEQGKYDFLEIGWRKSRVIYKIEVWPVHTLLPQDPQEDWVAGAPDANHKQTNLGGWHGNSAPSVPPPQRH
jgi:hypothetical protein